MDSPTIESSEPKIHGRLLERLPPHSDEAEQGTLGCILLSPAECMPECLQKLKAGSQVFYDLRHKTIFIALTEMYNRRDAIDLITLQQRLRDNQQLEQSGGLGYVSSLPDSVPSAANLSFYLGIVLEKFLLRQVLRTCSETESRVYECGADVTGILDNFEKKALGIRHLVESSVDDESDLRVTIQELTAEYERAAKDGKPQGLATGFYDLDKLIGGLKPQQFMVIAARPSVGKTALALNIAERIALDDRVPVAFFSLEMSSKELIHRLSCSRARVDSTVLNEGLATDQDMKALAMAHGQICVAPLHICDQGGLTISQLAARARRMLQRHSIKLLIVDYLGLLRSGERGRSRYEETTLVSNSLKTLAKELKIPLIVLAQLNRDSDRRRKGPRLTDLRDSGAVEQDGDIVVLLSRDANQIGDEQRISLIVAKQRNGRTGKVDLLFRRAFTRFESIC